MANATEPVSARDDLRRLLAIALPITLYQVGSMMLGVVDMLMVGHVGTDAVAAASLGLLWTNGTWILGLGVVLGVDPLISQAHGAQDGRGVAIAFQRGLVVAALVSVPVAIAWGFARPVLIALGQSPDLATHAARFVWVQIPTLPFYMATTAVQMYLVNRGRPIPIVVVVVVGNLFNALLDWVLIYGHLGVPALGLTGSGIATATTRLAMFGLLVGMVRMLKLHEGAWIPWGPHAFDVAGWKQIARIGLPTGITYFLEIWAFQVATLLAGRLGRVELAAHAIVLNMASLAFMIPMGIAAGAATRVGHLIGEGDPRRAQRTAHLALAVGAAAMVGSASIFALFRHQLPRLYGAEPMVAALAATILPIAATFQIFDGTQGVGGGILRGMGRTRPAAVFNLVGYYLLALPLAATFAFKQHMGLAGLWWGLALALALIAFMLVVWIVFRGPRTVRSRLEVTSSAPRLEGS